MQNTLLDNSTDKLSMSNALKSLLTTFGVQNVKIATGYWDIPGLALIEDELEQFLAQEGNFLQLLIGRELLTYANVVITPTVNGEFPNDFMQKDLAELDVKEEYKKVVQLLLHYLHKGKWEIRFYDKDTEGNNQFLHSKCYIFNGKHDNEKFAYGIVGSSNLTENGLSNKCKNKGNLELNYVETDKHIVNFNDAEDPNCLGHNKWFDEIWQLAEPWNEKYLEQVLKPSKIAIQVTAEQEQKLDKLTPYEAYIRILQNHFGVLAESDIKLILKSFLPQEIQMYDYQLDAAALCYRTLHLHGGFMLGDVVGLGKTIVGILLIKLYLNYAEQEQRDAKVLIVVPPAIKSSWVNTIELFDQNREDQIQPKIDFVTIGSIDKALNDEDEEAIGEFENELKQEMYGLIMIDESHNFRNNGTQMYEALDNLITKIGQTKGYHPYIGLLSATPQNNSPMDLRNQIYLFERFPTESSINVEGRNLEVFFTNAQKEYVSIIRQHSTDETERKANREKLRTLMKKIHDEVLAEILIRRTRADIRDGYKEDIHFPKVVGPVNLNYQLGYRLAHLFNDTMDTIAPTEEMREQMNPDEYIHYYRYAATQYLISEELKKPYTGRNMTPEKSSDALARIMQIMLVKRLESSFSAFKKSLCNLQQYTQNMITMWEHDTIFICPDIDVNAELNVEKKRKKYGEDYTVEDCFKDIFDKIDSLTKKGRNSKGQNAVYHRQDFESEYIDLIKEDKALIDDLVSRWSNEHRDPKLKEFQQALNTVLFDTKKNEPQKLVIFSEAIDTVEELSHIAEKEGHNPLLITAANRNEREQTIRENFDANYKGEWKDDYDIIITTEVLAEGVNLHRANTILNYDTPWNSTRLIQRIGRVNRIGSKSAFVYVYNFYPSHEGDQEINLVNRAFIKLQSFHTLFGEDNKVFSEYEELEKQDYKRLVEDSMSEYTPYLLELQEYQRKNAVRLEQLKHFKSPAIVGMSNGKNITACVVKTEDSSLNHYVLIDQEGKGHRVPFIEILQYIKCTPDTTAARFENPEEAFQEAIRTYNTYSSRLFRTNTNGHKLIDNAKGIIREWMSDPTLDKEAKKRLNTARMLISKNNKGIAQRIILLDQQLKDTQRLFGSLTPSELIEQELHQIHTLQSQKEGEPYIYSAIKLI